MAKNKVQSKPGGIGSDAVQARTGRSWVQWFKILDAAGCKKMNHKEIVAAVEDAKPSPGPWWRQMIAVAYEQERGLREKHQKPSGYSISRSKTLAATSAAAEKAFKDKRTRSRWLADPDLTIRKHTPGKSMRITWVDQTTDVQVNFYAKGNDKTQVAVEHNKLATAKAAKQMKKYWADALDKLKSVLEK